VTINVLGNDGDIDGDSLFIASVTQPSAHGSVDIVANAIRYLPKGGFTGTDTFSYTISDDKGGTATARVTVNVLR
jgi:hypothetical protein